MQKLFITFILSVLSCACYTTVATDAQAQGLKRIKIGYPSLSLRHVKSIPKKPYPTLKGIQFMLDVLTPTCRKRRTSNLSSLWI